MRYMFIESHKYKTLDEECFYIPEFAGMSITLPFVRLVDGKIYFNAYYTYDGPSGPTKDDDTNKIPALVHDGLYQMMREGVLDRKYRKLADQVMRRMCLEHGMKPFRAWYYYVGLRLFGKKHTYPKKNSKLGKIFVTGV